MGFAGSSRRSTVTPRIVAVTVAVRRGDGRGGPTEAVHALGRRRGLRAEGARADVHVPSNPLLWIPADATA